MDYDECHLYLRPVQFEFAPFKEDAGKPPPVLITSVQEDDSMIDRCVCMSAKLACIFALVLC